jgi:EAL domain-containing protein (putative c-di-GMP-specific phosphodiesterase class I)/GGDEF domain-containing protein
LTFDADASKRAWGATMNRNELRQATESAILAAVAGQNIAVVMIKLCDLHTLNNRLGYDAADALVEKAFDSLKSSIKRSPDIYRISATSFGFIVTDLKYPELIHLGIERALLATQGPFTHGEEEVLLEVIAGAAIFPQDYDSADALLMGAESTLMRRHTSDNPILLYGDQAKKSPISSWQLDVDLRAALQERQFQMHYQPQVKLSDESVTGLEALLRWEHPTQGRISPDHFLPQAESNGMIDEITEWIIQTALQEVQTAQLLGDDFTVSINLSTSTLFDLAFPYTLDSALALWSFPPERVIIEITESVLMGDFDASRKLLSTLRDKGIRISIDDFGTGYSSLAYFKKLPADELKIDRSFISEMMEDKNNHKIVEAIIDLAHKFNLLVVAEGIEDEATYQALRAVGCDIAQGYYIARPLAATGLDPWTQDYAIRNLAID